jgi:pimeloyl-ACP methyl ester carboxylesterase
LDYAQIVCDFLTTLDIKRAVIAGHSMGGAIAQQIALNMPDRAAGIILVGTGSKLAVDPTLPQRIIDAPERAVDWLIEWSWGVTAPIEMKRLGRERMLAVDPKVLQGDYLACMAFDVRDQLEQIKAPTLVLGSPDDWMVKLKFSQTLAERIPDAQLVVVNGGGHMFPLEQSEAVVKAVTAWFSEKRP